jgi:predicted dienelactone hydrolase
LAPTQDPESTFFYSSYTSSSLAYGGAPAGSGPFPLVVFSHGYGGCGTQSLSFTEKLARHGYVVAAPDHKDALCSVEGAAPSGIDFGGVMVNFLNFAVPATRTDQTEIDRWADLEYLIGQMLQHPQFGPVIDDTKIGGVGHSLGGYAVLGLGGAWISWKDARIKAVLGFSPYMEPFLLHQGLAQVQVPVMYQGAGLRVISTARRFGLTETPEMAEMRS